MENLDTKKAVETIRDLSGAGSAPQILLVLGSGWGSVVDALMDVEGELAYADIPGFPLSTVEGHQGRLLCGQMAGVPVWVMQGRFHFYEGYHMQEVTFPIRVFAELGIRGLILTNAAGGIDPSFSPGHLMLINDHINFMGAHPLRGPNLSAFGPRFPDMTEAWDAALRDCLKESASERGLILHEGVYLAVSGPSFETPAEIRAFSTLGANAVGMSTVPECIVGRHCGLRVAGLSCITNLAAHVGGSPLTHEEVGEAAREAEKAVVELFEAALPAIAQELGEESHVP